MLKLVLRAMLLSLLASTTAGADELLDASQALCKKVKACAVEQMATPACVEYEKQVLESESAL